MAVKSQQLGLTWAIFGTFAIALTALMVVLLTVVPAQAGQYLRDTLWERGKAVAREIGRKVPIAPRVGIDSEASAEIKNIIGTEAELHAAWVLVCATSECRLQDVVAQKPGTSAAFTESVLRQFNERRQPLKLELDSGELLVADPVSVRGEAGVAYILVALERTRIDEGLTKLRGTLLLALVVSMVVFLALVAVFSRLLLIRPVRSMQAMAARLSEADLSTRVDGAMTREFDQLAEALNSIGQGLRDTLGRVRGVSEGVAQVIDQISDTAAATSGGSTTVLTRVEETSKAMVAMQASLKGIEANVEVLFNSAEDSSSSILEMATTNDEVADSVAKMAASVEETTAAIERMTRNTREVAHNIEALLTSAAVTATSIHTMDGSISQVESNANETARLSDQVSKDAEFGMESIQKTIVGIDKIKDGSRAAEAVIDQLGRRIGEIGNIVDVIDDVAEQTNLLALNAAIIAAQAGDHGKGFAVVADEIKDLAERTGASTREIGELIRAVQRESQNAVQAMHQGVRNVDEGVLLGREAEGALKKIQESAGRSTQMVKAIARATVEQSRGSKDVTAAVERIRETVASISQASNAQAQGSEQVMKSAQEMKQLTQHVTRAVQEQAHGSKQISRSIESITDMVTHLNRAQRDQTRGSEQVLQAIDAIKSVADAQNRSVKQLEEALAALRRQAEVLRGEVGRFRV